MAIKTIRFDRAAKPHLHVSLIPRRNIPASRLRVPCHGRLKEKAVDHRQEAAPRRIRTDEVLQLSAALQPGAVWRPASPLVFQPHRPIFTRDTVTYARRLVSEPALGDIVSDHAAARGHRRTRVYSSDLLMAFGASLVADVGRLIDRERVELKWREEATEQDQFEATRGPHICGASSLIAPP